VAAPAVQERRRPHRPALRPAAFALTLLLLALAIYLAVNGPINVEQLGWNPQNPPADWARVHDRWQVAHALRTAAIVLALCCLTAATAERRPTSAGRRPV